MPREVNLDQQSIDAGVIFDIGGRKWFSPEPSHDLLKSVLGIEEGLPDEDKDSDGKLKPLATTRIAYVQAQKLLSAWEGDAETGHPTEEKPDMDWLQEHLTPRRASQILQEVLGGEERGSQIETAGTTTVPPSSLT